jgi:hypothetical protein
LNILATLTSLLLTPKESAPVKLPHETILPSFLIAAEAPLLMTICLIFTRLLLTLDELPPLVPSP